MGLGDVLDWKDAGDSQGGAEGYVEDAADECILVFQRLPNAANAQHVSVDAHDDVWVGGYPGYPGFSGSPAMFYKLQGDSGAIVPDESFDASQVPDQATGAITTGCGGFGGLVDDNGVLWSASQFQYPGKLLRYDPAQGSGSCIDIAYSYGLAESVMEQPDITSVFIWNSSKYFPNQITRIDADPFKVENRLAVSTAIDSDPPGFEDRGVAVTPLDNHVWVAKAGAQLADRIVRLKSDGTRANEDKDIVLELIAADGEIINGLGPTGLAVDANGKVWVVNKKTNNVMRIDPAGDSGRGVVDLAVDIPGAAADNFGDMAGDVKIGIETASAGTWTVIADGGAPGTAWDSIAWNSESEGSEPAAETITVEAQAADLKDALNDDANYDAVVNGEMLSLTGQYIKIRVTLRPDSDGTSPVLSDLVVRSLEPAAGMVCDVDDSGGVDFFDILRIFSAIRNPAEGLNDPRDWDGDGTITFTDARGCVRECSRPFCLPAKPLEVSVNP
jgi:streptogramin lyase